jgi:hypothetical protein
MADEKRDSPETGGKRRRPTTIDLKATEVVSEPAKPVEAVEITPETPQSTAPQGAAAETASVQPEPVPAAKSWRPDWLDAASINDRFSGYWRGLQGRFTGRPDWRLLGAGTAGALVVFALFLGLYASGTFTTRDEEPSTLAVRLALLEPQVRELANRPEPATVDPRALADLSTRLSAAEQAMRRLADFEARLAKSETRAETAAAAPRLMPADPSLTDRIAALETAVRPIGELAPRIEAANTAAREARTRADAAFEAAQKNAAAPVVAPTAEIEALTTRVAALEQAAKNAETRIAATAGADKAGRLAFVAVALRGAVERGDPFVRELAAAQPLVGDAKTLAPLESFAASGVPRAATLSRELSQLTFAMLAAAGTPPREGGLFDRLQANAERLVRIRPISDAPGDDPATIIGRAEVKATQGDLAGARAELASLPPAVRAPAQIWITRAEAREAALTAARDLAEKAIGALAKSGP